MLVPVTVTALTAGQLDAYVKRIGHTRPLEASAETLAGLHLAHMLAVPFETLDIVVVKRHIHLSVSAIYDKIVGGGRGGFCYEQNGLFASALTTLGFEVRQLSARVFMPDGSTTTEYDHMTLRVDLDEPWLADVGFGDSFTRPLRLVEDVEQHDGRDAYRLTRAGDDWTLWRRNGEWAPSFRFTERPHEIEAFQPRCDWLQTSPDSNFVKKLVCSRLTEDGRITITRHSLIKTTDGAKTETPVAEAERPGLLAQHFGVHL